MAMFDYSGPKFDFAPLANLADPILDQMEKRRAGEELQKYVVAQLGGQSLAGLAPAAAPAAPSMGAAMAPSQRAMRMPTDPETERKFLATVAEGGLTNPIGRAALAAHVNAESGFSPANFTRTWSDPSESGQPGTSGGALSWRGDRLTKMLQATRGSEDPVVAQAKYALVENPDVTMALQNAKSLEEAHSVWPIRSGMRVMIAPAVKMLAGWRWHRTTSRRWAAVRWRISQLRAGPQHSLSSLKATARLQPPKSSLASAKAPPPLAPASRPSSGQGLWPA
jgi:hypothetical protein